MDDLASKWKKLSLSHREGKSEVISRNKHYQEFLVVAKFLTKRNVMLWQKHSGLYDVLLRILTLEMLVIIISCLLLNLSWMWIRF